MIRISLAALYAVAETGPEVARSAPGQSFVAWYLRGRGQYGKWHDPLPLPSPDEALAQAFVTERMGYPCVVLPLGAPAPAGTDPSWWSFDGLCRRDGEAGEDFDLEAYLAAAALADPALAREFARIDASAVGG